MKQKQQEKEVEQWEEELRFQVRAEGRVHYFLQKQTFQHLCVLGGFETSAGKEAVPRETAGPAAAASCWYTLSRARTQTHSRRLVSVGIALSGMRLTMQTLLYSPLNVFMCVFRSAADFLARV